MARYWPEPPYLHDTAARTGILLVNLGTPDAPTAAALRPYLKEFLSDPRVVEIPRLAWWPILNGIILTLRPAASARKYASIWMQEGSPLKVHTERQAALLADHLAQGGHGHVEVEFAMRYGRPSIQDRLQAMRARGCTRILVLPLYPQYSASTTATVTDEVGRSLARMRNQPEIRFVRDFHDDAGYIAALARNVRKYWAAHGEPERLVMSFHGVPRRSLELGDPYYHECTKTGRLLAEALGLPPERALLTFQSRFGKAEWLQPYTQPTLEALAAQGIGRVDVICPGFVADCLETLEEIAMECRDAFLHHGGKAFHYIPCLNERHEWIETLAAIAIDHLGNWLGQARAAETSPPARDARPRKAGAGH
ncbi:ferrochelatase [Thauera linaloolentis]|uniref:Ferrochelatase n=1 Tax=Thauera linaloolentis (strain DSM 12138 / JCM 21573 / CCUG 41526 / CIP 105981 / IAM 15112 / NBRC 102519 / 47Lol) TaxID=1123367 RepID=N6Z676_THAL4|nr:ferrochelatase [Thauera linaloolentis]ENO90047.1 ferrochelatase [Thauera linaloolentis 47Lol = DSM 12138]MCM8565331.1 ferrochelatase [Thauera linaloolentis]